MKSTPQTKEEWERFWLVALVTLVLGFSFCFSQFRSTWLASRLLGDGVTGTFVLATIALGIYSIALLYRGRFLLALIGFIVSAIGTLFTMPTL
jgi:uncharacterized membrane protein (DUF485 family)